jgi:PAS domain S-box-containing protein
MPQKPDQVTQKMEKENHKLKQREEKLRESEWILKQFQNIANIGSWYMDFITNESGFSDELYKMHGVDDRFDCSAVNIMAKLIHPEDQEKVQSAFEKTLAGEVQPPIEWRIIRPDGKERIMYSEGAKVFFDKDNKPTKIIASVQDITDRKQMEEALKTGEEKYRLLLQNLPSIVYKGYKDWSIEFFDTKIKHFTGYDVDEFNSRRMKWIDIIIKEDIEDARRCFTRALKTNRSYVREYRIRSKDEHIHWIQERGQIICDRKGEIEHVSGVFFDITDHKKAEEALRKSEEKARALLNATNDAVVLLDSEGRILDINDTCARRFHKRKDEMMGLRIWDLLSPEVTERRNQKVKQVFESGKPVRMVDELQGVWNDTNIYPVCNLTGEVTRVAIFDCDITDRKRAEEQIHSLTHQLIKAQESERQRIARDLHDNLAQDLSLLKIGCDTLFDDQPSIPVKIRQKAVGLSQLLQESITAVRDMAYDLRPPGLDQLGLVRTVYQYCEEFSEKTGINVDFFAAGMDDLKIPFDIEINLYRLIQEALWNIKKHADANRVTLRLVASFPTIILRIEDDGKGFEVEDRLVAASNEKRMGLWSMTERVSLLKGKMRIKSRPAEGTKIYAEVPFKEKNYV